MRGLVVFAGAWLKDYLTEFSADVREGKRIRGVFATMHYTNLRILYFSLVFLADRQTDRQTRRP